MSKTVVECQMDCKHSKHGVCKMKRIHLGLLFYHGCLAGQVCMNFEQAEGHNVTTDLLRCIGKGDYNGPS